MTDIPFNEADQGQTDDPLLIFAWTDEDEPVETITPDEDELDIFEDSEFDVDDEPYIPF